MILGSNSYVRGLDFASLPPALISGTVVPYVHEACNLGVHLSSNLSWRKHVSRISQKVHASLHRLKYRKNSLSIPLRTKLVTALIFPHLDYCCALYHGLSGELNSKLQRLVNTCIRFIFNLRRGVHITPYCHQLRWLSVKNRRNYFIGILGYRILNHKSPSYIYEIFVRNLANLPRPTRQPQLPNTFTSPLHRTSTYRNAFHLSAVYLWHSLPLPLISSPSLAIFKLRLFDCLFQSEVVRINQD